MADHEEVDLIDLLMAREQAWAEAHRSLDLELLADILADDFVRLEPDGSLIDKEQLLASYKDRHWEIAESSDHSVRLQGETALIVGRWRGKGVNGGEPFDYAARFISVYVHRHDGWKMLTETAIPLQNWAA